MKLFTILLLLALPLQSWAALSADIVWEMRSAGADTNGGGYKTSAGTTDYSLQNGSQINGTVGTSTASTTFVDAVATFTSAMVGNILHLNSGAGTTVGFYEIATFVDAHTVTLDRASGTYTAGVWSVGGALNTLGSMGVVTVGAVPGNLVCVKADAGYTRTTTTDTFAAVGSAASPIRICGYTTTRPTASTHGDGYLGRTNGNGPLITTNMPVITYTTGRLNVTGTFVFFELVNFTGAPSNPTVTIGVDGVAKSCKFVNSSTSASAIGLSAANSRCTAFDNDCSLTGASGGNCALSVAANGARAIANRVTGGPGIGILCSGTAIVVSNTVYSSTGIGVSMNSTGGSPAILYNTIVGGGADGINIITGTTSLQCIIGNMITDNTGDGIDMVTTGNAAFLAYNRYRDNATTINNGGTWTTATDYGAVTSGTGTSDYTNSGSNDYSLKVTSPGTSASLPAYSSMGALQRSQTSTGASAFTFAQ